MGENEKLRFSSICATNKCRFDQPVKKAHLRYVVLATSTPTHTRRNLLSSGENMRECGVEAKIRRIRARTRV